MATKSELTRELFDAAVADGRIVRVTCGCPSVTGWWVIQRDADKACTGCGQLFTLSGDRQAAPNILERDAPSRQIVGPVG